MTEVIIPFERVGCWWHDKKGQKGIMLTDEVIHWFHNQKARYRREFLLGQDKSKWAVQFYICNPDIALLFKLTFGGR